MISDADRALAIGVCDLTSLSDDDTEASVAELAARAAELSKRGKSVAAVCVFHRFVPVVSHALRGTPVRTAAVAGDFPAAQASTNERVDEVRAAVALGADEVDVVMYHHRLDEEALVRVDLEAVREAAGDKTLKVILETGALGSQERVGHAARIALECGADFVKSSTGKAAPGADPGSVRTMAEAVWDFAQDTGETRGIKVSGGVRTPEDASTYIGIVRETLGEAWLTSERFRIGASSLLDSLV